jgi:hypothetical protein
MNLPDALHAPGIIRVEQPPHVWEADTNEVAFADLVRVLLSMSTLSRMQQPVDFTLNVSNVTIPADSADERLAVGDYIAVTVQGLSDWGPDSIWWPGLAPLTDLFEKLNTPLHQAHARFAYVRNIESESTVTVFFPRLAPTSGI